MVGKRGFNLINFNENKIALVLFASILLLSTIFVLSSISAGHSVGRPNYSIEKVYGPEEGVRGWVNMSFSSEPLDSEFEDSWENKINLSEILKRNLGYNYSCSPLDCNPDFTATSGSSNKQTTLGSGESGTYGIKLTGNIVSIDSFKFDLASNAAAACTSQVEIDFLDDSSVDFRNINVFDSGSCMELKNQGCFNSSLPMEDVTLSFGSAVCQKINLSDSPGFLLGAWIQKTGSSGQLKASIHKKITNTSAQEVASCDLPDATAEGGEISCSVNYSSIGSQEHYVCIYLGSEAGGYITRGYGQGTSSNLCGFQGNPIRTENSAFWIFAQGKQFNSVGTISMNKSLADGKSFAELASDYIIEKYGNLNCISGCVIPLKVKSNVESQGIELKNLEVKYTKEFQTTERNFYDLQTIPAKVSSKFQRLYLDGSGFFVPEDLGNYTFSLEFNNQRIVSERIQVKDVPIIKSLNPIKTASAFPTEFTATIDSKYNLTSFSWDFGDQTSKIITTGNNGNKATHAYNQTGEYTLTLNVTDSRGLSGTKTFSINVSSPAGLIGLRLSELKASLANVKRDVALLDPLSKNSLNKALGLPSVETTINSLESRYNNATEAQYNGIVADILKINLPEAVYKTRSAAGLPFVSGPDYVDLDVLSDIAGGVFNSSDEGGYINGVLFWQVENLETKVDFNEFSGRYDERLDPIVKTFKITAREKIGIDYDYYLILPELQDFQSDSIYRNKSGYIYVNLQDLAGGTFSFSTTEDINTANLPAFISPSISRLSIIENETLPEEKKTSKWLIFGLVILALLVIGIIVYIVLQEWYRRKYEKHLFPNRNDLYNMVNYVHNAIKKGLKNSHIEDNLKKAGWSGERIRYVMRKYAGKRTGMLEIPITKIIEKVDEKGHGHHGFK